jgi:hypothetical protein
MIRFPAIIGLREVHSHETGHPQPVGSFRRHEAQRPDVTRLVELSADRTVEAALLADEGVEQILGRGIEQPDEGQSGQHPVDQSHHAAGEQVRGERSDQGDADDGD